MVPAMRSSLALTGEYHMLHRRQGRVLHAMRGKNLVVDAGTNLIAELIDPNKTITQPEWMAVGDDGTTVLPDQTTLVSEIAGTGAKVAATSSGSSLSQLTLIFQHTVDTGTWTGLELREAGIFNNAMPSMGTMLSRFLTQVITLADGDVLDTTWILTVTGA